MAVEKLSPGMQQYLDIKKDYPDAFLLFRMGDFYELFYDDAVNAAQILEISLTSRNKNAENPIPMAGVPYHSAQQYIDVLVESGYKVAIAEQMEDPKEAKGVVKREVVQVITPGTVVDSSKPDSANNFLVALDYSEGLYGLAYMDLVTGEFQVTSLEDFTLVCGEIRNLKAREVVLGYVLPEAEEQVLARQMNLLLSYVQTVLDDVQLLGEELSPMERQAAGKLLEYVHRTQMRELSHLQKAQHYEIKDFLQMDYATKASLDLTENARSGKKHGSLYWLMDETWDTLYTATSTFPDSKLPINAHGFWSDLYQDRVILGHGGNTAGFSSILTLDFKSGIATVILTNQQYESNYLKKIPELIYGNKATTSEKIKAEFKPGVYRSSRVFTNALSITLIAPPITNYLEKNSKFVTQKYWELEKNGKQERLKLPIADYLKLSTWDVVKDYGSLVLWCLAAFYALLIPVSALLVKLYRLLFKRKNHKLTPLAWSLWQYLTCGFILSTMLLLYFFIQSVLSLHSSPNSRVWLSMGFAAVGVSLLVSLIASFFLRSKFQVSKGRKILTYLTSSASLIVVLNLLYWSLYQWWTLY